ncbi:MAG: cupin domain-containing protein [Acidimicrobiales bacterium]
MSAQPEREGVRVVELAVLSRGQSGNGVLWTLGRSSDLNVNLARLEPGAEVGEHVNTEVEVVLVALEGSGWVVVDDAAHPVEPASLAFVPRGARRAIRAGATPLVYLSIHRHREGLRVRSGAERGAHPRTGRSPTC